MDKIPEGGKPIQVFGNRVYTRTNIITNQYNYQSYTIAHITKPGCNDTYETELIFKDKNNKSLILSDLGNVLMFFHDIDKNNKLELFIKNSYECEAINEIYLIKQQ